VTAAPRLGRHQPGPAAGHVRQGRRPDRAGVPPGQARGPGLLPHRRHGGPGPARGRGTGRGGPGERRGRPGGPAGPDRRRVRPAGPQGPGGGAAQPGRRRRRRPPRRPGRGGVMTGETVAAVVITFQRRDMLRQTLEGLTGQERPVDEIGVIDNATTDGTAAMLAEEFPQVTHFRMEDNIGPAGALQVGFEYVHAKGHRWAWTHSDDVLPKPGALKTLVATPEQLGDDRLGLLCCWFEPLSTHYFHNGALWKGRGVPQPWPPVGSPPSPPDVMTFKGALISLARGPEIGLPGGQYFLMMEEYEYCL